MVLMLMHVGGEYSLSQQEHDLKPLSVHHPHAGLKGQGSRLGYAIAIGGCYVV